MPTLLVHATHEVIMLSVAKRDYGQFPANRYPAACASASLVKRTRFCIETFVALGQSGR